MGQVQARSNPLYKQTRYPPLCPTLWLLPSRFRFNEFFFNVKGKTEQFDEPINLSVTFDPYHPHVLHLLLSISTRWYYYHAPGAGVT